jgi:hypothetical protein
MTKRILMTVVLLGGLCGVQSFADTFVVGVENSPNATADPSEGTFGDFNDMIVQFGAAGLTATTDGTWQSPFSSAPINQSGGSVSNPFWDDPSEDGTNCNIGFYLNGTQGTCGGNTLSQTPAAVTEYLTSTASEGAPDANFYFTFTGGTVSSILLGAITPNAADENFGIYELGNGGAIQWIIENGVDVVGTSFTPDWSSFGLVFSDSLGGDVYYSQNSLGAYVGGVATGSGVPNNRYALFDLPAAVPEPGTMALFGIGALALGLIPRLRKRGVKG